MMSRKRVVVSRLGLITAAAAAAAVVLGAQSAGASTTVDAPTFAGAKYCGRTDRTVTVTDSLRVLRGSGTLKAECRVNLSPNASFTIERATLNGPSTFTISGGASSSVRVTFSTVKASGELQIFTPADAGDGQSVSIVQSTVQSAQALAILPSCAHNSGSARVSHSTLTAGTSKGVRVIASGDAASSCPGGSGGSVSVTQGTVNSGGAKLEIDTGKTGDTRLIQSTLSYATAYVHADDDGRCSSSRNSPKTPCS